MRTPKLTHGTFHISCVNRAASSYPVLPIPMLNDICLQCYRHKFTSSVNATTCTTFPCLLAPLNCNLAYSTSSCRILSSISSTPIILKPLSAFALTFRRTLPTLVFTLTSSPQASQRQANQFPSTEALN